MKNPLRLIYMGTPDFAVPPLKRLSEDGHRLLAVVTQPDRPRGRGRKLQPTPVKQAAAALGLPVLQPPSVRESGFIDKIRDLAPDWIIVAAFGQILPRTLLELPVYGCINIHASLLPRYRGPAPIQRAIINGETRTGVTTMLMDAGLDTGDILLKKEVPIYPGTTAGELHDRLAAAGADLLSLTLELWSENRITPVPQNHEEATYAPMLKKSDGHVDWGKRAEQIDCLVRGMTPWPGAFTFLGDRRIKIFAVESLPTETDAPPGTILPGFPDELRVATGRGVLAILELQGASGKRMPVRDFLMGSPVTPGQRFT